MLEHHALHSIWHNSQFHYSFKDGVHHILYTEDLGVKNNSGRLRHKKVWAKTIFPKLDKDCCPVRIFTLYHCKIPMRRKCGALYLWPKKWEQDGVWYEDCLMGVNQLWDTVKTMCKSAGFEGTFSNHSLRLTSATRIYESGIEEQVIAEITGHQSLCVWSYKRTNIAQKRKALEALSRASQTKTARFEHQWKSVNLEKYFTVATNLCHSVCWSGIKFRSQMCRIIHCNFKRFTPWSSVS